MLIRPTDDCCNKMYADRKIMWLLVFCDNQGTQNKTLFPNFNTFRKSLKMKYQYCVSVMSIQLYYWRSFVFWVKCVLGSISKFLLTCAVCRGCQHQGCIGRSVRLYCRTAQRNATRQDPSSADMCDSCHFDKDSLCGCICNPLWIAKKKKGFIIWYGWTHPIMQAFNFCNVFALGTCASANTFAFLFPLISNMVWSKRGQGGWKTKSASDRNGLV